MGQGYKKEKAWRTAALYLKLARVSKIEKRNQLRGFSAKSFISPNDAEVIRQGNSQSDSLIVGAILKGPSGLLNDSNKTKWTSEDLFKLTAFPPVGWRSEVCYTIGYVNSTTEDALKILSRIKKIARLDLLDTNVILDYLLDLSKEYGASNYLSFKLAYIRSARELTPAMLGVISQIEEEIQHRECVGFHFSAIENISSKIPIFELMRRRASGLFGKVKMDFRKSITLSNYIPTPLDEVDVSGYLLRSTESCLIDTVYSIIVILNMRNDLSAICKEFEKHLNPEVFNAIVDVIKCASELDTEAIVTDFYRAQDENRSRSLDLYRISSGFLENPKFAAYRSKFDKVIGARLLTEVIDSMSPRYSLPFDNKSILVANTHENIDEHFSVSIDAFYRTFLFLRFISNKINLLLISKDEIKFIFEHTIYLEVLLTEKEMTAMYVTADTESKGLIALLALALYKKKSIDPDIDFEFRTVFVSHVKEMHHGSIIDFIEYLLVDSPHVASYLIASLDEVTLEKMYTLVENATQAAAIRSDILRAVGLKTNRIEYIIEADAITTRSKVSNLQHYFDSSRIYVDSVSMMKWLDSNPTASTEQFRSLLPAVISSIDNNIHHKSQLASKLDEQYEYLVSQIAKDAFEQFCLNTEFGIESYLGRRIRHNTLDGVTTDTVDAVLRKPEYGILLSNITNRHIVDSWMDAYKSIIHKLRREYLQFKSNTSLFKADLDMRDPTTIENIRNLTTTLKSATGGELLNELIMAFCWKQIAPQLDNAARFIKTTLLREANASIDKYFPSHGINEGQIKADLHDAVNDVFKKIADWFQVPQTGFISATVNELCQIILIDLNRINGVKYSGDALDVKYTGISVHRLYDCLAVLLQNAIKHGEDNTPIIIHVSASSAGLDSSFDIIKIEVTSSASRDNYGASKARIFAAIDSVEGGIDMVTEGYSGIKKLKFITRASEGRHTLSCDAIDSSRILKLCFSLRTEKEPVLITKGNVP